MKTTERRILVTGSRKWPLQYQRMVSLALACELDYVLANDYKFTIVHGACPDGVDRFAESWAVARTTTCYLTVERHPAMWDKYGKSAGFRRNEYMVKLGADRCLAFIFNRSKGATHCADKAEAAGIEVIRFRIDI